MTAPHMADRTELPTESSTLTIFEQEVTLERVAGVFTPTPPMSGLASE